MRTLLLSVVAVLASTGLARPAAAHAVLVDSQPKLHGTVPPGPVAIAFRYNSRIDARRSRLLVIRADKTETVLPMLPDAPDDQLLAQVDLTPGQYTVRWQVLAVDGHITRGDVPFTVGP